MLKTYNPTRHFYLKEMIAQRQAALDEALLLEQEEDQKRTSSMPKTIVLE